MWEIDRRSLFLIGGIGSLLVWLGGTVLGKHPDGGLLGFSGTMFAIFATGEKERRRRDDRGRRGEMERAEESVEESDREP